MKDSRRSWPLIGIALALLVLVLAPAAQAEIPATLKSSCVTRTPHPGFSYRFCDDGVPPVGGRVPNIGGVSAVRVPYKYDGFEGLPAESADAASPQSQANGADPDGMVALDVDISMPTTAAPPGGYPVLVFMHGCCSGSKLDFEGATFDTAGERWHFNNAWFASRGYVVVNYTARGFRAGTRGSTGETQLDSRRFEINDFQYLTGLLADDPFFDVAPRKVVTTGGSYGGGFAWLALTDPKWLSPGGKDMTLAATAPRYGWTDLAYSLVPNGSHSMSPGSLPAFDGSDSTNPVAFPKQSILQILYTSGTLGSTFPPAITESFACLNSNDPFETNALCASTLNTWLPEFVNDRSPYYQNQWFDRIAADPSYRIPIFNAGTLTDPLFWPIENIRMANRIHSLVPDYPIQEYYGDYEHFVQNKAKEWGDICGSDRHVCRFADYPGGDVNASPAGLVRTGVTTRLNRFIDHYATPGGDPSQPEPSFNVTASLQICPANASAEFPADSPGPTFTARRFAGLAPYNLPVDLRGTQTTRNPALDNPHSIFTDPFFNFLVNGGRCPVLTTPAGGDEATYTSEPLAEAATMIGGTRIAIDYQATTAAGLQLNTRMYDVFPDGRALMVDRGVKRVTSAGGTVEYQLQGNGWRFEPGHRIRVEITQDDAPYIKASVIPSSATMSGVRLRVPVREPQRGDFRNAARFCAAQRRFFGQQAFADRYGTNKNAANAFGKCVSDNH